MAELEVVLPYNSRLAKTGLGIVIAFFPIWGLLGFMMGFGALFTLIAVHFSNANRQMYFAQALACVSALFIGMYLMLWFADNRIIIGKDGLCFPRFLSPLLRFKRQRRWQELHQAQLDEHFNKEHKSRRLRLVFKDGVQLNLRLGAMSFADVTRLVLAIDVWASQYIADAPSFSQLKQFARSNGTRETLTYTALWEEELQRRFNSTCYVPLEPQHKLQGGHICILQQMTFGGLSAIYLAQVNNIELMVVKEVVLPSYADEEARIKAIELFERQAELLAKVNHPSICKVHDHFVEDGRHYLLLEYMRGEDMRLLVKQSGPQSETKVLAWAKQIADMLRYLHGLPAPILHRDLTPDNLVLRQNEEVCLIDFGAANQFMSTATGTLIGKQAYMSPEQFRGKATFASDIYSLGCTLFFLLTGRDPVPLTRSRPSDWCQQVSRELDDLVAACTELDLDVRIKNCDELDRRIQDVIRMSSGIEVTLPSEHRTNG